MAEKILLDAFFAAVAAIGFAAISNPPRSAFKFCALIAAVGHSLRYFLINAVGMNIIAGSLSASVVIGLLAIFIAPRVKCPPETFSYPSLLPMIPGIYAYRTVQAFVLSLSAEDEDMFAHYSYLWESNGMTCVFIILAMVIGQMVPIMVFKRISYSATK